MLVSKQWLKQFIPTLDTTPPAEIARSLTLKTVEVEGIETQGELLENVMVGLVVSAEKHPDADKLKLCQVDVGPEKVQIVCGGSNVREGMKVALGKIGAKVRWHGEGELVELVKAKIRGVESYGMICAADEIGLGELFPKTDDSEILDLSHLDVPIGTPLAEALGLSDVIFDIDNKSLSNRPDLFGQYGIAREVAAIHKLDLKEYYVPTIQGGKDFDLSVKIEAPDLCSRYMAVAIDGIEIAPSPMWLQQRLQAVGIRPINNIVDITNFVMMELGQPMHAFDVAQLAVSSEQGASIVVRRAKEGEKFVTLDEKEHTLSSEMLVIADEKKPIALAGVMGGVNSEISDATKTIIFESATFDAASVRKTSTALGIRTDSSTRFEKSQDPVNAELALKRAVELTLELCSGASVVSELVDEGDWSVAEGPIELPVDYIVEKIGSPIPQTEIVDILSRLGFGVDEVGEKIVVTIPSWRATKDISIQEDIVEEIIRLYGYENVPATLPLAAMSPTMKNALRDLEHNIRDVLASECAYTEVYNYSFNSPDLLNKLDEDQSKYLELENPIAKDRPYIRRHLIPGLLENAEANLHRFDQVKLFEIGKVFVVEESGEAAIIGKPDSLPKQDTLLGMVYAKKGDETPFYELTESVQRLLDRLGVEMIIKKEDVADMSIVHPGRCAEILVNETPVGRIAELHPAKQEVLGIPHRTAILQLNLSTFVQFVKGKEKYRSLSVFPSVERDIAFVVDQAVEHSEIQKTIQSVSPLIVSVELFDVYQGEHIESGKKSMAYHVVYQSEEKTLEAGEVDKIHEEVLKQLGNNLRAVIRS